MTSGDETYLEAFVESLTTLPYQVRRNLELVQDLDGSYQNGLAQLQELYTTYIQQAEEKILQLEVAPMEQGHGVRVIRKDGEHAPVIIPTTAEFMEYTYDANAMRQIEALQVECLQKADEKVCVARQAYEWIDAVVDRLDDDLQALSKLLQAQGEFQQETIAQPNDLAACQVGNEWILAKVLEFDNKTRTYKLIDEDVESHKVFHLPEDQVVVLRGVDRLSKGDSVYAVYPDTTSFYQATVVQVPRKTAGQTSPFVIVSFLDDSDEFGVTHDKAVQLQHIMVPPGSVKKRYFCFVEGIVELPGATLRYIDQQIPEEIMQWKRTLQLPGDGVLKGRLTSNVCRGLLIPYASHYWTIIDGCSYGGVRMFSVAYG